MLRLFRLVLALVLMSAGLSADAQTRTWPFDRSVCTVPQPVPPRAVSDGERDISRYIWRGAHPPTYLRRNEAVRARVARDFFSTYQAGTGELLHVHQEYSSNLRMTREQRMMQSAPGGAGGIAAGLLELKGMADRFGARLTYFDNVSELSSFERSISLLMEPGDSVIYAATVAHDGRITVVRLAESFDGPTVTEWGSSIHYGTFTKPPQLPLTSPVPIEWTLFADPETLELMIRDAVANPDSRAGRDAGSAIENYRSVLTMIRAGDEIDDGTRQRVDAELNRLQELERSVRDTFHVRQAEHEIREIKETRTSLAEELQRLRDEERRR